MVLLLCNSNKQSARQSAIVTGERCIVGVVLSAKYGGIPSVGALFD